MGKGLEGDLRVDKYAEEMDLDGAHPSQIRINTSIPLLHPSVVINEHPTHLIFSDLQDEGNAFSGSTHGRREGRASHIQEIEATEALNCIFTLSPVCSAPHRSENHPEIPLSERSPNPGAARWDPSVQFYLGFSTPGSPKPCFSCKSHVINPGELCNKLLKLLFSLHPLPPSLPILDPPPGFGCLLPAESIRDGFPLLLLFPLPPSPTLSPRSHHLFLLPPHLPRALGSSVNPSPCPRRVTAPHKCTTMSPNQRQPNQFRRAGNI